MLPDDIFLFFLFFNTSRITSWRIKKKAEKNTYNPTDLEVALPRDSRGYSQKKAAAGE